ncbi:putative membrane protein [Sinomonas atrocyanea]|uniref:hypothetical protein n=1 Tax=Sinomonas atrocyanea TaxID=37927 RepID=UPI00278B0F66|nr:hypothetical protein [Sinomonas atrocyanea]MDP9885486.1 putative membrane protein [Sinomonas atrocyanea]
MENFQPKNSLGMIVSGVIMAYLVAPIVLAINIPMLGSYSRGQGAMVGLFFGIGVAVVGMIFLIVGLVRVLRTIDFLGRRAAASQGSWV